MDILPLRVLKSSLYIPAAVASPSLWMNTSMHTCSSMNYQRSVLMSFGINLICVWYPNIAVENNQQNIVCECMHMLVYILLKIKVLSQLPCTVAKWIASHLVFGSILAYSLFLSSLRIKSGKNPLPHSFSPPPILNRKKKTKSPISIWGNFEIKFKSLKFEHSLPAATAFLCKT